LQTACFFLRKKLQSPENIESVYQEPPHNSGQFLTLIRVKESLIYSALPAVQGSTAKIERCKRLIL
jgi:hypothetical protein